MRTRYKIDTYQQTYFVIEGFQDLFDATATALSPYYAAVRALSELDPHDLLDDVLTYPPNSPKP